MPKDENNKSTSELQVQETFQSAHDVYKVDAEMLQYALHMKAHETTCFLDVPKEEKREIYKEVYRDTFQRVAQMASFVLLGELRSRHEYEGWLRRIEGRPDFEFRQNTAIELLREHLRKEELTEEEQGLLANSLGTEESEQLWDEWLGFPPTPDNE